jgi:hypothetical protein
MSDVVDEWTKVEPTEDKAEPKVEFEIEAAPEETEEVQEPAPSQEKETPPKELDGIETQGAQKRIRQLIKQRKDREDTITSMQARINEYESRLQEKATELVTVQKKNIDASEISLNERITQAQLVYKNAIDENDSDAIVKAQTSLNQAQLEMAAVINAKGAYEDYKEAEKAEQAQAPITVPKTIEEVNPANYDPMAVKWATDNDSWFGTDQIMTATALAIDAQLKEEGYDPSDDEFYTEIDTRLRDVLPSKFKTKDEPRDEDTTETSQVVAGGSRSPTIKTPSSKKVKLTQEDVRLAEKWGIPLERYAQRKLEADKADGGYTEINV